MPLDCVKNLQMYSRSTRTDMATVFNAGTNGRFANVQRWIMVRKTFWYNMVTQFSLQVNAAINSIQSFYFKSVENMEVRKMQCAALLESSLLIAGRKGALWWLNESSFVLEVLKFISHFLPQLTTEWKFFSRAAYQSDLTLVKIEHSKSQGTY